MITDRNTPETDLLFQHFATLATGPGGVPRLRELILQLAIYGKIYTYDTDDDPVKLFEIGNKTFPPLKIFNLINLPKGWIWSKLGNIAEVGQGGTPRTSNPEFWNGSIPWLRSGNIKFNRINQANETISELGLKNSAAKLCPIGTVLLAMTGQGVTRGRAAILDIEASANQSCAHIILNKN
jgi:Type I restriction modification DNA specificity domain.